MHGFMQFELGRRLYPLGGKVLVEASVVTSLGLLVADVAWGSADFIAHHGTETPFSKSPELCVEIASPSNSLRALREKMAAYVEAGATEAWIVFPKSRRIECFAGSGLLERTAFAVDLEGLFE